MPLGGGGVAGFGVDAGFALSPSCVSFSGGGPLVSLGIPLLAASSCFASRRLQSALQLIEALRRFGTRIVIVAWPTQSRQSFSCCWAGVPPAMA